MTSRKQHDLDGPDHQLNGKTVEILEESSFRRTRMNISKFISETKPINKPQNLGLQVGSQQHFEVVKDKSLLNFINIDVKSHHHIVSLNCMKYDSGDFSVESLLCSICQLYQEEVEVVLLTFLLHPEHLTTRIKNLFTRYQSITNKLMHMLNGNTSSKPSWKDFHFPKPKMDFELFSHAHFSFVSSEMRRDRSTYWDYLSYVTAPSSRTLRLINNSLKPDLSPIDNHLSRIYLYNMLESPELETDREAILLLFIIYPERYNHEHASKQVRAYVSLTNKIMHALNGNTRFSTV